MSQALYPFIIDLLIFVLNEGDNSSEVSAVDAESSLPAAEVVKILRFSDLTAEIRNQIYQLVLGPPEDPSTCLTQLLDNSPLRASNGRIDTGHTFRVKNTVYNLKHQDSKGGIGHNVRPQDLSILLVSKQTYLESVHVFYSTNCLSFTNTGLLYRFLKNIGYARRQHLTMIYFQWRGPHAKEAFCLLKTCRRLRRVEFTVPCSHPPGYEALKEVRVETAKARALIHYASAQPQPSNVRSHTSCFGDYGCHCKCRRAYEPASRLQELEEAMMRPRRPKDLPDPEETFDLFNPKRELFKKSEDQDLLENKASFNDFTDRMDQQGRALVQVGRRDKAEEAYLNGTLTGSAAEKYFRRFEAKLAADKKYKKAMERWYAKREAEQARELKRRTAREAKERKKMMAQAAKAQKKAAGGSNKSNKMTDKGDITA